MERGTYQIELYRSAIRIGRPQPYTGFRLNAEHFALRKGHSNNADFARVLDDGVEFWSKRLNS
jgi:hypothetical protein